MADVEVGVDTSVANAPVTAEVVTPVPNSTAEPVETPEGAEPQTPEPEKMLPQSEVNKLIQKRERLAESRALKIARAEAERDFYKRQFEERERAAQPQPQGEPNPDDFQNNPRGYVKALIKWERQQEREAEREEQQRESVTERQERSMAERARIAKEKLFTPGAAKYRDFNDVVLADDVPITEVMVAAAARLKNGVDVLYHLGNNRDEAMRIAQLPDIEQAWALKDLETKVTAPPKPTQTPPPIVPNTGSAPTKKGWEGMSTAEHVESWLKRKRR